MEDLLDMFVVSLTAVVSTASVSNTSKNVFKDRVADLNLCWGGSHVQGKQLGLSIFYAKELYRKLTTILLLLYRLYLK